MEFLPGGYHVNAATWFYLSLLLIVAVFFRFNRIWSLRNLDLILLLAISPGLLLAREASAAKDFQGMVAGYVWLFVVTALLLLRLVADSRLQRRPRMEQNLNAAGLGFLCVAAFVFLTTAVIAEVALPRPVVTSPEAARLRLKAAENPTADATDADDGPTSVIVRASVQELSEAAGFAAWASRITAVLAHLAVLVVLLLIGRRHFGDFRLGLAMATLYLLLPCTAFDAGKVNHVLPAALIAWAVFAFQRPIVAGSLFGLACGTLVFPVFLLPLWLAFYPRRGALRFGAAVLVVGALLAGSLALTADNAQSFRQQITGSIDWSAFEFDSNREGGFWVSGNSGNSAYRIPVQVGFVILLVSLSLWPRKKNLEHLLAHSTAIIVAIQFWYPRQGGELVLWYLPLALMVVFRPRLVELRPPEQASEEQATAVGSPQREAPEPAGSLPSGSRLFR